jgi:hypothetical protein
MPRAFSVLSPGREVPVRRRLTTAAVLVLSPIFLTTNLGAATPDAPEATVAWKSNGCEHGHARKSSRRGLRAAMTVPKALRKRSRHFVYCVHSEHSERLQRRYFRRLRTWRRVHRWQLAFRRMPNYEQQWALSTARCESGMHPAAHGGPHHGAMQFTLPTARAAGFIGDPHNASLHEQLVRGIRWKWRAGAGQWPVCGR